MPARCSARTAVNLRRHAQCSAQFLMEHLTVASCTSRRLSLIGMRAAFRYRFLSTYQTFLIHSNYFLVMYLASFRSSPNGSALFAEEAGRAGEALFAAIPHLQRATMHASVCVSGATDALLVKSDPAGYNPPYSRSEPL